MASETHNKNKTQIVNGVRMPELFDIDLFRSGLQYKARPDDIFIVTFPRSGTNWMSVILYSLLTNGEPFDNDIGDFLARLPFIDRYGIDSAINMPRPGVIQTHYPFDRVPYNRQAKYIGVIREPKDVCVSLYQLLTENSVFGLSGLDFDTFFELFIKGETIYVDFYEHLRLLWSHKDDDNVLLISYEQMQQNLHSVIEKITQFLDINPINKKELFDRVEIYASFDYMKKNLDKSRNAYLTEHRLSSGSPVHFIRRGTIGDWSSCMTDEQSQRMDAVTAEKTRDMPGLQAFWKPQLNAEKHDKQGTI